MTGPEIAELVLLSVGVVATLVCCLGIVVMRDTYDRLHFLSGIGTLGPVAIVAAVIVEEGLSAGGLKALVVLAALVFSGPVLTHAIARAARIREGGAPRTGTGDRTSR
jgi:multicomponent Na+:H+ antiporter subunit G